MRRRCRRRHRGRCCGSGCRGTTGHRHRPGGLHDVVYQAELPRVFDGHVIVSANCSPDLCRRPPSLLAEQFLQHLRGVPQLVDLDDHVRDWQLRISATRLVDHQTGMRKCEALSRRACSQQHRGNREAPAVGDRSQRHHYLAHDIKDGQARMHQAPTRVNEDGDRCIWILGFEVQQLLDKPLGGVVVDLAGEEDTPELKHFLVATHGAGRSFRCRRLRGRGRRRRRRRQRRCRHGRGRVRRRRGLKWRRCGRRHGRRSFAAFLSLGHVSPLGGIRSEVLRAQSIPPRPHSEAPRDDRGAGGARRGAP
mmetsp:Transcript_52668/g.133700  ORF Transcript_52668/g.133700 Transcript_52668/m.133700 type:complete len:307 (+) Transcript_52668:192-1112(+)